MATVSTPRLPLDKAVWGTCNPCPMPTLDPYNYPIVAATPHDWYKPAVFVSGCENPANSGSSGTGGGSFLYDPIEDAWMDIPHFLGMDPSYSTAGTYSHGAATFHPTGPTGTATAGSASGITIDKYLAGDVSVGATIRITGGTGSGQSRTITSVSGAGVSGGANPYLYPQVLSSSFTADGFNPYDTVVVTKPTGTTDGDLLIAVAYFWSNTGPLPYVQGNYTVSPPAGWTDAGIFGSSNLNGSACVAFWKRASSEPGSYTFTLSPSADNIFMVKMFRCSPASVISAHAIVLPVGTSSGYNFIYPGGGVTPASVATSLRLGQRSTVLTGFYDWDGGASPPAPPGLTYYSRDDKISAYYQERRKAVYGGTTLFASGEQWQFNGSGDQCNPFAFVLEGDAPTGTTTLLTVDSAWSVQPDATSTYEIDSGSFWCWRGNASDATWCWAKYDIARGVWEQKTSADAISAPTFVNATVTDDYTYGPITTLTVPSGVVNGDLLVGIVFCGQNGITVPAGWNSAGAIGGGGGSVPTATVIYRTASSEPASYSVTRDGTANNATIYCVAYRNAGTPKILGSLAAAAPLSATAVACSNLFTAPAVVTSVAYTSGSSFNNQKNGPPLCSNDTQRLTGDYSRLGDRTISQTCASADVTYTWTYGPDGTTVTNSSTAEILVLIPGTSPGMSNYGKADPSKQGGIHAVTDSSDYVWLGGDTQTSLRRYSISGDSWSALTAHEPSTRPLRNVGGGMAYQTVSGDPYIFYWVPNESENAYDNTARFYAYDLTGNLWYDLLVSPGSPASAMPSKYKRILSYSDRILWLSDRFELIVQDPTKIDALTPDNYLALVRNSPSRSGGTPFMVTDSTTGSKFLYHMEHTNVQGIQPLRCNVTGRDWV